MNLAERVDRLTSDRILGNVYRRVGAGSARNVTSGAPTGAGLIRTALSRPAW